ncbi:hypothetical protein MHB48_05545 [Psychrobacillus sp. FSL H8-0483]|uniref:hypothetical protein n=1 Tax=Psychrobacillus sp. FSL H8-0483 TaxID=2921389 RepID=UPI00315A248D
MKIILSFLSMLLIVTNSVLLLFQYHVYSSGLEDSEQSFLYEQEIEIKLKKDKLMIRQHFMNLPEEKIKITWPISSENRSCYLDTSESCNRLSEDLISFKEGDTSKQSISYEIPLIDGLHDGIVLSGFLAKLEKGGVSYTTLHITDELKKGGMWVSGLPIVGTTSLDEIDYSLFFGAGSFTDLYWQEELLPVKFENDNFTIHSKEELSEDLKTLLTEMQLTNSEHISVLFTENKYNIKSSRIAFVENKDLASIQRELIIKNVQLQYGLVAENLIMAEVISSFLTDSPIGSEKSIWMYETLTNYFTEDQLSDWKKVLMENKQLSAQKLDGLLSEVIELKTSFFTLNEQFKADKYPLLFEDNRTVYINDQQQKDVKVLFKDGKVMYAAEPLLTALGYTLKDTDKGLYVQNAMRAFRFPIKEPFYVLNDKRYDAMSEPFEKIGADFYLEESWMNRLFLVDIEKQEKRISVTQSASF